MYKIAVLNNKIYFSLDSDFKKAKDYFATHNINVEFTFINVNSPVSVKEYLTRQGFSKITGQPAQVKYMGLDDYVKDGCRNIVKEGEYDIVMFVWDMDSVTIPDDSIVTSFTMYKPLYLNTDHIQLAINKYFKDMDKIWKAVTHEILHAICYSANRKRVKVVDEMDNTLVNGKIVFAYLNDDPYAPDGNYAHTFKNLQPFLNKSTYKYFKDSEVVGLKEELVRKLDEAREIAGVPFKITSGLRTIQQNEDAGGVADSSHLKGLGCDLSVSDGGKRYKILKALLQVGFNRLGIYALHIHVDCDTSLPQEIIWHKPGN